MSKIRYSSSSGKGGATRLVVHALGQFQVLARGNPLHLQSRASKPLQLLKVLIALGSSSVSVEQLTESLWPESDGDRAYGVFTITLRRLRELIGQDSIILRNSRVSLDPDSCWVDAVQFARHASEFSRTHQGGNHTSADQNFQRALDLYRGPFLPGEYAPGEVLSARTQLHAMLLRMVLSHGDHFQSTGDIAKATSVFERGLEVDDSAEVFYQRLMRCYALEKRFNDCIALFQRCSSLLEATSGVSPSIETQALVQDAIRALKGQQDQASAQPVTDAGGHGHLSLDNKQEVSTPIGLQPPQRNAEKRVATVACFRFHLPVPEEEVDPETFQEILSRAYATASSLVSEFGGELAPLVGNSALAVFGSRVTSENDAELAVRAAITLRDLTQSNSPALPEGIRFAVSAGIATGAFAANASNGSGGIRSAVVGAPANRATNLASQSGNHHILADSQTWHAVRGQFSGTPIRPGQGSNGGSQNAVVEIHKSLVSGSRFDVAVHSGLSPFLAREWELESLHLCYDLAQGGQGQIVSVVGDPGIGKSRLVHEFRQSIAEAGGSILEGRCQSIGLGVPYRPIQEILRSGLGLESQNAARPSIHEVCERILGISPRLERYVPHLLHLLALPSERHKLPDVLQGSARRHELQDAFVEFISELAKLRTVVLVCEDWHWADESSDATLYSLVTRARQIPLLVVVAYRTEYHPTWTRYENHRSVLLRPLDSTQSVRLLHSILKEVALPTGLEEAIYSRTQGNALFIEELAKSFADVGFEGTPEKDSRGDWASGLGVVPHSIQAVIRARIDRLASEDRELLRICSAIGQSFSLNVVEQVVSPESAGVPALLDGLTQMDMIRPLRLSDSREFQFKHVLTHEVVYDTLLLSQRRDLHERIGEAIEAIHPNHLEDNCEQLAHHYFIGDNKRKAAKYLEMSGDKAARQTALEVARQDYEKALALINTDLTDQAHAVHSIELTHKLASVSEYAPSGKLVDSLNSAREIAARLPDRRRLAQTIYWMGRMQYIRGNLADALNYFDSAIGVSEAIGDTALHARCLSAMGRTCVYTAEHERGISYLIRSLEILEGSGNFEEISYSSHFLGLHYGVMGDFEKALAYGEKGLRIAVEGRMISRQPMAQNQLAWLQGMRGNFAEGLQAITGSQDLTRKAGDTYSTGIGAIVEGWLRFMSGEHVAGIRLMAKGIDMVRSAGSNMALTQWHAVFAEVLALVGDAEEAREHAQQALAIANTGQHHGESIALRALAITASKDGKSDFATVDQYMEESLAVAGRYRERPYAAITRLRYSELLLKRGDTSGAVEQSAQARVELEAMRMNGWLRLLPR